MGHSQSKQLKTAVKEERWKKAYCLLKKSNYSSSVLEQFIAACEEYENVCVNHKILPHCTSQQRNRLLETAVKNEIWEEVRGLLRDRNYSGSVAELVVTACEKYGVICVDEEIMSHFTTQQLDRLLTWTVNSKLWRDVYKLLKSGGSQDKRVWVIEEACQTAINQNLAWYILPHVDDDFLSQSNTQQLDRLLTAFANKREWGSVGKALKAGGSLEKRVWVIEQASLKLHDTRFIECIAHHINDDLLAHCSTQQLDSLLKAAATHGLWRIVDKALKTGGSHEMRVWVIEQACQRVDCTKFIRYILPHADDDFLSHCDNQQLDRLLTTATDSKWWDVVGRLLKAGGSTVIRVWVIKEACITADRSNFQRYISPHCDDHLYTHIVKGVNPLTNGAYSVLFCAVRNELCPQGIVAECIRLGFSTHQPPPILATTADIAETVTRAWMRGWDMATISGIITSPFLLAVSHALPVVAHMLYESGSCSYPELLHLYTVLLDLSDPHTEDGRKFLYGEYLTDFESRHSFGLYSEQYKAFLNTLSTFLPYLREMASTPRSLESSCRLVISHCLTVGGRRDKAVQQLPLPDGMKDYLLFSDLTDPDYQPRVFGTMSAALLQQE